MKRILLVIAAGLLTIGTAQAQTAATTTTSDVAAAPAKPKHKTLKQLETELNLTADQKPLWDSFIQTVKTAGKTRRDAFLQSRGAPKDLPSRLAQREKMAELQQKAASDESNALTPLWAKLTEAQKTVLNDEFMVTYHRPAKPRKPRAAKPAAQ